jgi:hypothetical protein
MSRKRLAGVGAGLVIALALISRVVLARSSSDADPAADTTGASSAEATSVATTVVATPTAAARSLLVINPRNVQPGASIGVWGSGFPGGATVDIYVKHEITDNINPVTLVEADDNGQFSGINVTVPDSVGSGDVIIQAKQYDGPATAMARPWPWLTPAQTALGVRQPKRR